MKRALFRAKQHLICLAILASSLSVPPVWAQEAILGWVNHLRDTAGAPPVEPDELLSRTAQAWSESLAAAGILSHVGADGSRVLDRYRAQGGTEARAGEILGAGKDLPAVEAAWVRSDSHRRLVIEPAWTNVGWGSSRTPNGEEVWVVVFCQRLVKELAIRKTAGSISITGSFTSSSAVVPLLFVGLRSIAATSWAPAGRRFDFEPGALEEQSYLRLGYLDAAGVFVLTNAFTLRPGMVSQAARDRSSTPAASP